MRECADLNGCFNADEHELVDGPRDEYNSPHMCWEPLMHSGPPCGGSLPVPELLAMTVDEVLDYVADTPDHNFVIRTDGSVIDVLDCSHSEIVGRVTFAQLAQQ